MFQSFSNYTKLTSCLYCRASTLIRYYMLGGKNLCLKIKSKSLKMGLKIGISTGAGTYFIGQGSRLIAKHYIGKVNDKLRFNTADELQEIWHGTVYLKIIEYLYFNRKQGN